MNGLFSRLAILGCTTVVMIFTGCGTDNHTGVSSEKGERDIPFEVNLRACKDSTVAQIAYSGSALVYADDMDSIYAPLMVNDSILHGVIPKVPVGHGRIVEVSIFSEADSLSFKSLDTVSVYPNEATIVEVDFKDPNEIEKEKTGTIVIKIKEGEESELIPYDKVKEVYVTTCDSFGVDYVLVAPYAESIFVREWYTNEYDELIMAIESAIMEYMYPVTDTIIVIDTFYNDTSIVVDTIYDEWNEIVSLEEIEELCLKLSIEAGMSDSFLAISSYQSKMVEVLYSNVWLRAEVEELKSIIRQIIEEYQNNLSK